MREEILKKGGLDAAESRAFFCKTTRNADHNVRTLDINLGRITRPNSRDAWEHSFKISKTKGLDPMVMVGTQLNDLTSTLKPKFPAKAEFITTRVSNFAGEHDSAVHNTVTQSFNFTNGDPAGMDANTYALLQQ